MIGNKAKQTALLCGVSLIVLAIDLPGPAAAQTTLAPVTVDAPKPAARPRVSTTTTASRAARTARRASARPAVAPAAPVPTLDQRAYAGDHGYVAGQASSASKTGTPLIDTPRSVSVIDRKELDDRGVANVVEAVRYTAGVTTGTFGFDPRFDSIMLRGFPAVTFGDYRDGLRQHASSFSAYRTEPFQLSSIEVIKGPAAVLYGQSVPGGLIDRRSKLPVENQVNEIHIQGGTYGRMQTAFDIGGANPDKSLLYRLVGLGRLGDTNYDIADERLMLAPSLTWRPNIDTTLTVYALLQKDETDGSVAMINRDNELLRINGQTTKIRTSDPKYDHMRVEQAQIGYKLEHRIDDVFTFRQNTRFNALHGETRYLAGYFTTPTIFSRYPVAIGDDQQSVQTDNMLQADFATGPIVHKTLFGVNYDRNAYNFKLGFGGLDPAYALNILNPTSGISGPTTPYTSDTRTKLDQVGVYLQDQMRFGNWHLSLSGRQDWADRVQNDALTGALTGSQRDSAFTYSAGLLYHFENGIAPYVSYATSFQPVTDLGLNGVLLAPAEGEQIEGGIKYQPRSDVLLTASVYDLKEKNASKLAGYVNGVAYYASVGEIRVQGFEFEGRARITPEIDTVTTYTYSDAQITKSAITTEVGKTPAVTPKHMASSWLNYTFRNGPLEGLGFGAGVRYIDATWTSNDNLSRNNGYTLFDLAARYDFAALGPQFAGYQASINANNVAGEEVAVCNAGYCYLSQGRTVIGTLRYRW